MSIWALSDLHLSFSVPSKSMEVFGPSWKNYAQRIQEEWIKHIQPEDLVLIAGDISWAKTLDQVKIDLEWIDALPGTKLIIRGNHDYWWDSSAKMEKVFPKSIHFLQNNAFNWKDITIGGARLWDTQEYNFSEYIELIENPREKKSLPNIEETERIYTRDLERLKLSLSHLNPSARIKIAMTHYPPIGPDLITSRASAILEEFGINFCVFGHLHSIKPGSLMFGEKNGVNYLFTSCDFLHFIPLKLPI